MATTENTDPGRIRSAHERVFGIRMQLPPGDPMILVLGEDWESFRWYATEAEREAALAEMRLEHRFSRVGDRPTVRYERVQRDKPRAPLRRPAA